HVPFANIGIPTADLIINFWDNPDWPYHHTTEDNMDHISRNSLKATGETVEQFIYNNYYNATDDEYEGNFPYEEDINIPPTEIIIFIISVIGIIGISVIAINLIRNRNLKRILEEEKGKNDEISER
ncbi:MAG: M28 family peptidase, partial [Promethearchaeota archaeon]